MSRHFSDDSGIITGGDLSFDLNSLQSSTALSPRDIKTPRVRRPIERLRTGLLKALDMFCCARMRSLLAILWAMVPIICPAERVNRTGIKPVRVTATLTKW